MNLTDELDEQPLLDREIKEFRFCALCGKPFYHRDDYHDFCTPRCEFSWLSGR